jgi:hypothetical protein
LREDAVCFPTLSVGQWRRHSVPFKETMHVIREGTKKKRKASSGFIGLLLKQRICWPAWGLCRQGRRESKRNDEVKKRDPGIQGESLG